MKSALKHLSTGFALFLLAAARGAADLGSNHSDRLYRLLQERNPSLLEEEERKKAEDAYLERIAVRGHGQSRIVPVEEITHITAEGAYAELHTGDDTHGIRERMKTLAVRLRNGTHLSVSQGRLDELEDRLGVQIAQRKDS